MSNVNSMGWGLFGFEQRCRENGATAAPRASQIDVP
jgi:hypothetical protein